ncbi:MAG TPA: hypothetical protein VGI06_08740 [Acidimicrobiales bacterium]
MLASIDSPQGDHDERSPATTARATATITGAVRQGGSTERRDRSR